MALVMSQMPDVWRKVLAEHVPDHAQRCRECRDSAGQTASWPCQTYRVAQEAKWVAEGNLPGTGPHGPGPSATPRVSPPSTPPPGTPSLAGRRSSFDSGIGTSSFGSADYRSDYRSNVGGDLGSSYGTSFGNDYASDFGGGFGSDPDPLGSPSYGSHAGYGGHDSYSGHDSYGSHDRRETYGSHDSYGSQERHGSHRGYDDGPYGSAVDAPYGASFGVDDHRRHRY